ncbi:MAG: hypothetical protein EXR75_16090 [Myxococcales bacterium]|nr:hypothetical protein [Myxococcales bacterium]
MTIANIRLAPDDAMRVKALRGAGIPLSTLVRAAIRAEYERRIAGLVAGSRPSRIVADILLSLPDPADLPRRGFESDDRHALRRHVAQKLERR